MDLREVWAAQAAMEIPGETPTVTPVEPPTPLEEHEPTAAPEPQESDREPEEQENIDDDDDDDARQEPTDNNNKKGPDANLQFARIRNKYKREYEKEREERQKQEIENVELRTRLEERQKQQAPQAMQEVSAKDDPMPDPNYDKEAYLEWKAKKQDAQIEALTRKQEALEYQTLVNDAIKGMEKRERKFAEDNKDYNDAKNHLITNLAKEIRLQNPSLSEEDAHDRVAQYQLQLGANYVEKTGRNPAELFYDMAKLRGYAAKSAAAAPVTKTVADPQKIRDNNRRSLSFVGQPAAAAIEDMPLSGGRTPDEWRSLTNEQVRELDRKQKEALRRSGQ